MNPVPVLAPLAVLVIACAPSQTAARQSFADTLLRPGQTWDMTGTTADGKTKAFSVTLGPDVTRKPDGFVGYFDPVNRSGLAYGPADTDPEFLAATLINLSDPADAPICVVLDPSLAINRTVFQGRLGRNSDEVGRYVTQNRAEGLGSCTLTLGPGR